MLRDQANYTAPTWQHELDNTDHTDHTNHTNHTTSGIEISGKLSGMICGR